jgi:hypothetical protein
MLTFKLDLNLKACHEIGGFRRESIASESFAKNVNFSFRSIAFICEFLYDLIMIFILHQGYG